MPVPPRRAKWREEVNSTVDEDGRFRMEGSLSWEIGMGEAQNGVISLFPERTTVVPSGIDRTVGPVEQIF